MINNVLTFIAYRLRQEEEFAPIILDDFPRLANLMLSIFLLQSKTRWKHENRRKFVIPEKLNVWRLAQHFLQYHRGNFLVSHIESGF